VYTLSTTKQFEKDYKLCLRRGYNMELIHEAFYLLEESGSLPAKYKAHKLEVIILII